jgi:hypothetical protein
MTGKMLARMLLGLPIAAVVCVVVWLNASVQSLMNIVLGLLLAVVAGSFAFVLVRVVPIVWQRTGIDDWIEKLTGSDTRMLISLAVAWMTRSWFLWLVVGVFWEVIFVPPVTFLMFYFLFFPGGQYRGNAGSIVMLGIIGSYAAYGLCAKVYWDAYNKAAGAST